MRVPTQITLVAVDLAPHEVVSNDRTQGYTIYRPKQPLAPGATMDFDFTLQYAGRGFRNTPEDTRVVDNGTFLDSGSFPHFGYGENDRFEDRNDRRKSCRSVRACRRSTTNRRGSSTCSAATPTGCASNGSLTVTVDAPPYEASIAPYNKLIDRVSEDNRKRVTLQ